MAKERAAPVQVRFSPETLERLRTSAAAKGSTLHAEIVDRVDQSLSGTGDPEVDALKVIADHVIEDFVWAVVPGHADDAKLTVNMVKASLLATLDKLGADAQLSPDMRAIGEREAANILSKLRGPPDTPLGRAGATLGVKGAKP
jgi:hypothetical protein